MMAHDPVLYLSPRDTEDGRRLHAAALARGWDARVLPGWRAPVLREGESLDGGFSVYGEPLFARMIAAQVGHVLYEPTLDWLHGLPASLLGRTIGAGPLSSVASLRGEWFVKPADSKTFRASLYTEPVALLTLAHLDHDEPVLWSSPVHWAEEYRVFVCDGVAVTSSLYARDHEYVDDPGDPARNRDARAFVAEVIASVPVPPATTIDVGLLDGARWAVIEANPCWGAGLYHADADAALDVMAHACVPLDATPDALRCWTQPLTLE